MLDDREIQRNSADRHRVQEEFLMNQLRRRIRAAERTESLLLDTQADLLSGAAQEEFQALVAQFEIFLREVYLKGLDWLEYGTPNDRYIAFTKKLAESNPTPEIFHLFIRFAVQTFKNLEWEVAYVIN